MQGVARLKLTSSPEGVVVYVKASPGSASDRIVGVLDDRLKIAVTAAPEKGKANQAIVALLAGALGVPKRAVVLRSGATTPHKAFAVAGISAADVRRELGNA